MTENYETLEKEMGKAMDCFLGSISQESRVIFLRRYLFCDTIEEIAKRYRISRFRVKNRLRRTKIQLSDYLNREGNPHE